MKDFSGKGDFFTDEEVKELHRRKEVFASDKEKVCFLDRMREKANIIENNLPQKAVWYEDIEKVFLLCLKELERTEIKSAIIKVPPAGTIIIRDVVLWDDVKKFFFGGDK